MLRGIITNCTHSPLNYESCYNIVQILNLYYLLKYHMKNNYEYKIKVDIYMYVFMCM